MSNSIQFPLAPHNNMCYNTKELKITKKDTTVEQNGCLEIKYWKERI